MSVKTVGEFARETAQPEWRIRRIVDALPLEIPRIGQYRLLSEEVQTLVRKRVNEQGAR